MADTTEPTKDRIQVMQSVLSTEADALYTMRADLGAAHQQALDYLAAMRGRVVCTGVGKSGHIACKAAATFASTGTQAQFVHATEASHGDLGMLGPDDVCLALSNSGETSELADIITYTRRFDIPLIAITRHPNSTLGRQADVVLPLPQAPEACLIGVAPTTSTTASLALCDALAVALMQSKGFRKEDFQTFHPGGRLGTQLLRVDALMHTGPALPLLAADTPMGEGLVVMSEKGFGIAGVVNDAGALTGVITDGDLRRNLEGLLDKSVGDVATHAPKTVDMGILASEALKTMNDAKVSAVFVLNGQGTPVGILHIHDCIRAGII